MLYFAAVFTKLFVMPSKLSIELSTEIVLLHSQRGVRETARIFNQRHPERPSEQSIATVTKIWDKFKTTGSVHDKKRSGRPIRSVTEEISVGVLAAIQHNPHSTYRSLSREAGISIGSVSKILSQHKYHPYKMTILHQLKEIDYPKTFAENTSTWWQIFHCFRSK